jgi:hypothetical protein
MGWYVRSFLFEWDVSVHTDDGPFDRYFAELVLADIGIDGTIQRGLDRVRVERAILVLKAIDGDA